MRRAPWVLAALCLALIGCRTTVPGHISAMSVRALDLPMTIVASGAEGRACGSGTQQNIPAAIEDALAKHPGANALMNIAVFKQPRCIRVTGTAVRIEAEGQQRPNVAVTTLEIASVWRIPHSRQAVFEAWVSPETAVPPYTPVEVDLRVGGIMRLRVDAAEAAAAPAVVTARFEIIRGPEVLVYSWQRSGGGVATVVTVEFEDAGEGQTRIRLRHTGFAEPERRDLQAQAWDDYVRSLSAVLHSALGM